MSVALVTSGLLPPRGIKAAGRRASPGRPHGTAIELMYALRLEVTRQWLR